MTSISAKEGSQVQSSHYLRVKESESDAHHISSAVCARMSTCGESYFCTRAGSNIPLPA